MRLIVTGCGRSGTQWTAAFLQRVGLRGMHESAFSVAVERDGPLTAEEIGGRWGAERDFDCSWLAAPMLRNLPDDFVVWHQFRNPFKVARCWASNNLLHSDERSTAYVRRHLPAARHGDRWQRAASYVVGWNELVRESFLTEPDRVHRYHPWRIEDASADSLHWLLLRSGFPVPTSRIEEVLATMHDGVGGCSHRHADDPTTWDDFLRVPAGASLERLQRRLGYEVEPT